MKCEDCDGHCCKNIILRYHPSGKAYYKNHYPAGIKIAIIDSATFTRQEDLTWFCSLFKNGKCMDYENRPNLCKQFFCKKHDDFEKDIQLLEDSYRIIRQS